ncbi:MAG: rane protein [Sphingobacteriaceae bacterium]|jgi:hypothetical protein|nr:rane protein [Sphingobacteriaceae bacterium]
MNTKLLMSASAILLGAIGISLTFFPQEISSQLHADPANMQIIFQILGSLYFGFAMLNWMAQWSIIGGIFNRPIAIANFSHFLVGALALVKWASRNGNAGYEVWALAGCYIIFGILFGRLLSTQPVSSQIEPKPLT